SLKAIGLKLALDDFGTGYSSLSYLQRVPFDKIKIDRSFVTGASDPGGRNAALIRAMVALAGDLHMPPTAEGGETHDEPALVRRRDPARLRRRRADRRGGQVEQGHPVRLPVQGKIQHEAAAADERRGQGPDGDDAELSHGSRRIAGKVTAAWLALTSAAKHDC